MARVRPSCENSSPRTSPEWPLSVPTFSQVAVFQRWTGPSVPDEAISLPSGEKAVRMAVGCVDSSFRSSVPSSTFQSQISGELQQAASVLLSGEMLQLKTWKG